MHVRRNLSREKPQSMSNMLKIDSSKNLLSVVSTGEGDNNHGSQMTFQMMGIGTGRGRDEIHIQQSGENSPNNSYNRIEFIQKSDEKTKALAAVFDDNIPRKTASTTH